MCFGGALVDYLGIACEVDHHIDQTIRIVDNPGPCDQRCDVRVGDLKLQPGSWVRWVERYVCAPGAHDAQRGDDQAEGDEVPAPGSISTYRQLQGKELSYNNVADSDAAWECVKTFAEPACVIVKHANPCGVAVTDEGTDIAQAHAKAHACDPVSAFGGVIAANRPVTAAMAAQVKDVFTEVVVAPAFEPEALEILSAKKNLRLLSLPEGFLRDAVEAKQVSGGMLLQIADAVDADGDDPATWTLAAGPAADEAVLADLAFAWRAVRAAKGLPGLPAVADLMS